MTALIHYLVAFMLSCSPVKDHRYTGATDEYTLVRYESIAADIAGVALDPDEPALFDGPTGRVKTALLMTSIASFESGGFREDVDTLKVLGDGGAARCLLQIHPWIGEKIVDRASCLRSGLRHLRESYRLCHSLSGYTVGHCEKGEPKALKRFNRANDWLRKTPFAPTDDDLAIR